MKGNHVQHHLWHRSKKFLAVLIAFAPASQLLAATQFDIQQLLQTHLPAHPRLLLHNDELTALKSRIVGDLALQVVQQSLLAQMDRILNAPPVERVLIGKRLLDVSRQFESRVVGLAFEYRLTGEKKYADRAKAEMLAVAAFSDWHPEHFLDVAEITAGMAVGYDWLYDTLSEVDRLTIHHAIVEKGLTPSYTTKQFWIDTVINWSSVCHGSLTLGALAVAEDESDLAAKTIARAANNVPHALNQYTPDGAYPEGPSYWEYGTTFNVLLISALRSTLGTDLGLMDVPGFIKTGDFMLHATGPSGEWFNFSDSGRRGAHSPAAAMWWFAGQKNDDSLLFNELQTIPSSPKELRATPLSLALLLVWSKNKHEVVEPTLNHYVAAGPTPVAFFRSSWKPDATFFGIKGGSPSTSHAQMDVGCFVFDMNGIRFGDDLGMQDYNSLETQGIDLWNFKPASTRWNVFRISAAAQSIITVDGQQQIVAGHAKITDSGNSFAIVDETPVYAGQLASIKRGMRLANGSIQIQDEIIGDDKPHTLRWAMLTRAAVSLAPQNSIDASPPSTATLTRSKQLIYMDVIGRPPGMSAIRTYSTTPPHAYDAPNPGTQLVGFDVKIAPQESATITVNFYESPQALIALPLTRWKQLDAPSQQ